MPVFYYDLWLTEFLPENIPGMVTVSIIALIPRLALKQVGLILFVVGLTKQPRHGLMCFSKALPYICGRGEQGTVDWGTVMSYHCMRLLLPVSA